MGPVPLRVGATPSSPSPRYRSRSASRSTPPGAYDRRRSPPFPVDPDAVGKRALKSKPDRGPVRGSKRLGGIVPPRRIPACSFRCTSPDGTPLRTVRRRRSGRSARPAADESTTDEPRRTDGGRRSDKSNRVGGPPPALLPRRSADEERRSPRRPSVGGRWNVVALGDPPILPTPAARLNPNRRKTRLPGKPRPRAQPASQGSALAFPLVFPLVFVAVAESRPPRLLPSTRKDAAVAGEVHRLRGPRTSGVPRRPPLVTCPFGGLVSRFQACFAIMDRHAAGAARRLRTRDTTGPAPTAQPQSRRPGGFGVELHRVFMAAGRSRGRARAPCGRRPIAGRREGVASKLTFDLKARPTLRNLRVGATRQAERSP